MHFAILLAFSRPLWPSLFTGAPPDLLRLPLWYGGWQALFDFTSNLWIEFETL